MQVVLEAGANKEELRRRERPVERFSDRRSTSCCVDLICLTEFLSV